ncbi:uncharacterized protein LOC127856596 isoform X2 [Dreissena polymorpha]|uniref:uncharacterized protein LOC127856596 isoform X2 n=1 Tax=Dreissena polymorpha TaxID=45954 RepID=UPI00226491FB|nr:uncharacterized protein LOC127856596 isoform X2 [Dreissena polymorpha]
MGQERPKLGKKPDTSRTPRTPRSKSAPVTQQQPQSGEFDYVREDFNLLWTSWVMNAHHSDMWRRIEQTGLDNTLRKLAKVKSDLRVFSSVSSDDALSFSSAFTEMNETLTCIRLAFIENGQDIYDNDEREHRFKTATCPSIVSIWSTYSTFAYEFASNFIQRGWLNSSEHKELLSNTTELAANAVKLLLLALDVDSFHNHANVESLRSTVLKETEDVSKTIEQLIAKTLALGDSHTAVGKMTELLGWMLYGLHHTTVKVIQQDINARSTEESFNDFKELIGNLNAIYQNLPDEWKQGLVVDQKPSTPPVIPIQQSKQGSKDDETNEKKAVVKEGHIETIQKLGTLFDRYNTGAREKQRLPVVRGRAPVELRYPIPMYRHIQQLRVDACTIVERQEVLKSLPITEDHSLQADVFSIGPTSLNVPEDVIIQFPLLPSSSTLGFHLWVRSDGKWTETANPEIVTVDDQSFVWFSTRNCDAFTAMTYNKPDCLLVTSQGVSYVSPANGKVEVIVPKDCFYKDVELGIKITNFDWQSHGVNTVGVIDASVALSLTSLSGEVTMRKPVTVELPLDDEHNFTDTELVVVRYDSKTTQVLDRRQLAINTTGRNGVYSVDIKGFWCVAILRIRRVFLNMRETIKREFLVGYRKRTPCNIVTYIDDISRVKEAQIFLVEIVEKMNADAQVEQRRAEGLIEVRKSRSREILLQRGDCIRVQIDGQMRVTEVMSEQQQTICFLQGCDNSVSIATEVKRDPEKLPDAMIFYQLAGIPNSIHSVALMTRDLSELPTDAITARSGLNMGPQAIGKEKEQEDAAVQILKMESLMSLARELTFEEAQQLGRQLGVKTDHLRQIREAAQRDRVAANFQILCKWRGRYARATMADFLVSSLKAVGKTSYADLVTEVRKHNRGLEREDFRRPMTAYRR